eukprot:TRINITY_DN1406_c0_g1_i1.p1 TRINITY_DN1406_c0_g1~~TRINITY_DN1406_c0_g1_i1.p1  ORF type:complete len:196 (-),score=11.05 TRINITY_DN1406_c0_g1_i1:72-638(-)
MAARTTTIQVSLLFIVFAVCFINQVDCSRIINKSYHSRDVLPIKQEEYCPELDDCHGHGECLNQTCICQEYYGRANCSYQLKSQEAAFIIAVFLGPIGADQFYLGYTGLGLLKLFLTIVVFCIFPFLPTCCLPCTFENSKLTKRNATVAWATTCGGALTCGLWWAIDSSIILWGNVHDSNGFPLVHDL